MNLAEKSTMSPQELRSWRARMGMTQAALAAALGLGLRTVTGWERGEAAVPRLAQLAIEAIEARLSERSQRLGDVEAPLPQ